MSVPVDWFGHNHEEWWQLRLSKSTSSDEQTVPLFVSVMV